MRPFYLIPPVFKCLLFAVLTIFIFQNKTHAAAALITPHFKTEKTKSNKRFLKKQKRLEKRIKKLQQKSNNYDDFDYNILLGISLGLLLVTFLMLRLSVLVGFILLLLTALLLMICVSNGAHPIARWALVLALLLILPIGLMLKLSNAES